MTAPSATSYLFRDSLGSVTDVTDDSGTPTWQYSYDPYGNPYSSSQLVSGADGSPMRHAGQLLDPQTSQYDMRARVYDPTSMRFDSQDPLQAPLNQSYTGAYVYADGDPALFVDPTGMFGWEDVTGAVGGGLQDAGAVLQDAYDASKAPAEHFGEGVVAGGEAKGMELVDTGKQDFEAGCFVEPFLPSCIEAQFDQGNGMIEGLPTFGETLLHCGEGDSARDCGQYRVPICGRATSGAGHACTPRNRARSTPLCRASASARLRMPKISAAAASRSAQILADAAVSSRAVPGKHAEGGSENAMRNAERSTQTTSVSTTSSAATPPTGEASGSST